MMWGQGVNNQVYIAALSFGLGIVLCFYYDVLRTLRNMCRNKKIATFVCDIFFFATAAVVYFCFLQLFCNGMGRFYVMAFCGAGFVFCRITVSKHFVKAMCFLCKTVLRIYGIFKLSVDLTFKVCAAIFGIFAKKVKKALNKGAYFLKKLLKCGAALVYNTTDSTQKNILNKRKNKNGKKKV